MEKQDQWLQRVLGVTLSGGPAASDDDDELDVAALTDWLDDIAAQAAALPKQVRADLLARAKQARPKLQPDTIKEAAAELMALTTEIADAARTARMEQATAESGTVVYQALVRQWQEAQDAAHTRLDGFVATLLADPELQEDPRFPNLQQAA